MDPGSRKDEQMNENVITIAGNVATAPAPRGPGGTITSFRLASTQRRFDKETNGWIDAHTNWFTVSAFRQLAVHALSSLQVGQRVIVTGRLKIRTWENASGKGTGVDIEADAIGRDLLWGTDQRKGDVADGQAPVTEWAVETPGATAEDWGPSLAAPSTPSIAADPPEAARITMPEREPAYAGQEAPF